MFCPHPREEEERCKHELFQQVLKSLSKVDEVDKTNSTVGKCH